MLEEAIEITPIVFASDGDAGAVATFDRRASPYETLPDIVIAAGDEVVLLEGTYQTQGEFEVPDGVRVRGMGTVILQPFDTVVPGTFMVPLGSAQLVNLTLRGYDTGILMAFPGTVTLEDVSVEFSLQSALAISGFAGTTTVRAVNSRFVSRERDGIVVNDALFEMHHRRWATTTSAATTAGRCETSGRRAARPTGRSRSSWARA